MSHLQKHDLLALSVAALVASSVVAIAGVTTFNNDLTGEAVYFAGHEPGHPYDGGSAGGYTSGDYGGYAGGYTSGATGGSVPIAVPTTNVSKYTQCVEVCTMDGWKLPGCANGCKEQPGAPSTTTTSTTTATIADRCAYTTGCAERIRCLIELGACGSPKAGEKQTCDDIKAAATARGVKNAAVNMETGMAYCDELKAVPAPAVKVPEPTSAPATTAIPPPAPATTERPAAPVREERGDFGDFEDDDFGDYESDFVGGDDDFGDFGGDFGDGFHGGPEAFGDFDYGGGFDPSEMDGYFGYGHEGDFGEEFGGMPSWMQDELESTKDMMRSMGHGCSRDLVDEIDDVEDFDGLEELGFRMQEECSGGDFGGPMDDPSEAIEMLQEMVPAIQDGLTVLLAHGFDAKRGAQINALLHEVEEAAGRAEEACADVGFGTEDDFFGLKGLLAQLFDDDEEEGFNDEEGEACREALEEAFSSMDDPEDPESEDTVRGLMEGATEDFFRSLNKKSEDNAIAVCEEFMEPMTAIVQENGDETPADMCAEMAENDFNFPDDHEGKGGDFDEGDEEGEDEFNDEDFDF